MEARVGSVQSDRSCVLVYDVVTIGTKQVAIAAVLPMRCMAFLRGALSTAVQSGAGAGRRVQ